jgi:lysyl-tRNA synthetase class 2
MEESEKRKRAGKDNYPFPEQFLHDLNYMPPCAGIAFGIDRFVMLLTDSETIDDVVTFTHEEL